MNRLFDDALRTAGGSEGGQGGGRFLAPRLDVHESENEYSVVVDLPGVAESDLDLSLEGDVLTIRGEKKQESERDERGYHIVERSSGTFQRSIRLPFEPDPGRVNAECQDGVLTVHVPKEGQQERVRKIAVNRGSQRGAGNKAGNRTIEARIGASHDRQKESMQQAASGQGTQQVGGSDDASRGQAHGRQEQQSHEQQQAQAQHAQKDETAARTK